MSAAAPVVTLRSVYKIPVSVSLAAIVTVPLLSVIVTFVPAVNVNVSLRFNAVLLVPSVTVIVASRKFSKLESPSAKVNAAPFPALVTIVGKAINLSLC